MAPAGFEIASIVQYADKTGGCFTDSLQLLAMANSVSDLLNREWAHLNQIVKSAVIDQRDWYKRKAYIPMMLFRWLGAVVILVSFSISALSFFSKGNNHECYKTWIFFLSLLVSAITAFMSFFQFQAVWRSRRQTEMNLSSLLVQWELDLIGAADESDSLKRATLAREATRRCVESASKLISAETSEFFSGMSTAKDVVDAAPGKGK
jgi:magnesium-transporting ATPase (P-type)